jgi:hypothetical protein
MKIHYRTAKRLHYMPTNDYYKVSFISYAILSLAGLFQDLLYYFQEDQTPFSNQINAYTWLIIHSLSLVFALLTIAILVVLLYKKQTNIWIFLLNLSAILLIWFLLSIVLGISGLFL